MFLFFRSEDFVLKSNLLEVEIWEDECDRGTQNGLDERKTGERGLN